MLTANVFVDKKQTGRHRGRRAEQHRYGVPVQTSTVPVTPEYQIAIATPYCNRAQKKPLTFRRCVRRQVVVADMADPSSPDPAAALPLLQRRGSPQLQQLECSSADGASLLATASTSQQTCPDPALILPPPPQLQPTERSSSEEEELMLASALTRALSDLSVNVPSVPASPQTFRDCEGSGPCTPTAKTPQSRSSFTGKTLQGPR